MERPNRFIALVELEGKKETVHVKNTGRCRELLIAGATVYLEDFQGRMGTRKTRWDLVAVEKRSQRDRAQAGDTPSAIFINMDAQAPNKVVWEALKDGSLSLPGFPGRADYVKAEAVYGGSRLDFYVEAPAGDEEKGEGAKRVGAYIEVKGVTLEEDGVARFPDAPTLRGIKHIRELCGAREKGFYAYVIFVIQMEGIRWMEPNDRTHKAFGDALREAGERGVTILALDCRAEETGLTLGKEIPVRL